MVRCKRVFDRKFFWSYIPEDIHTHISFSFTNSSQRRLLQHQATVHEGFKYVCDAPGCEKTFLSQSGLKNHKEGTHENISFECVECNKTFNVKHLWREHNKIHHEKRVVQCDFCDRSFKYRSSRIAHMKARHAKLFVKKKCKSETN